MVHSQEKLAQGIWVFYTSRHGGIITDTNLQSESKFNEVEPSLAALFKTTGPGNDGAGKKTI